MTGMTIAALARAGGVGVETVRYYQRRGLLPEPERPAGPGLGGRVRRYGEAEAQRLRFIRAAKAAGFSLDEVAELVRLDASRDRAAARALARHRLAALDARLAELHAARDWLARLEGECAADAAGPCPILQAFDAPSRAPLVSPGRVG